MRAMERMKNHLRTIVGADLSVNCLVKAADKLELAKGKFGRVEGQKLLFKGEIFCGNLIYFEGILRPFGVFFDAFFLVFCDSRPYRI